MTNDTAPVTPSPGASPRALWRRLRKPWARRDSPLECLRQLEARHGVLLARLWDLAESAPRRPKPEVDAEREALEATAAGLRQQIEAKRAALPAGSPGSDAAPALAPSSSARVAVRRGFAVGAAAVAVLLVALVVSGGGNAPGRGSRQDAPTPQDPHAAARNPHQAEGTAGHTAPSADLGPEEKAAMALLERNPNDLEARLELARLRLDKQDYMAVWDETGRVLERAPDNPRALTYQSQVRLAMGQPDVAKDLLERALAQDPALLQAYIYLSQVHLLMGQEAEAEKAISLGKRAYPAQAAWLDAGFAQMKATTRSAEAPAFSADDNPHARLRADVDHAEMTSVVTGRRPVVSGTIELDAAFEGGVPAGAVVFMSAREAGFAAGPPLAAKRLPATFPLTFALGPEDSMQGERLPDRLLLEVRIDLDGDASTREPTEAAARLDEVESGASGLRLVLKRAQ